MAKVQGDKCFGPVGSYGNVLATLQVTGNNRSWVLIVNVDSETGKLTLDENFAKSKALMFPGSSLTVYNGLTEKRVRAFVHGALFGPKREY